jgi:DNA-binding transcriptional MocR family regulator
VLGPRANELRAAVGTTAWSVLEEMMQGSTGDDDHVAEVSIRSLASSLGLAKDTVARAVRRLSDLGVVVAVQTRSDSGVFDAGSYRLAIPAVCLSLACLSQPPAVSSVRLPAVPPSSARRSSGQLALYLEV